MSPIPAPSVLQEGQMDILRMAAKCFAERGYNATSIDDVARRLGCTKGRIYHFFASKADLFFGVYRVGMDTCFDAIRKNYESDASAFEKLQKMSLCHTITMMKTKSFQRVVREGVEIHVRGATTPEQRDTLEELLEIRENYSLIFKEIMEKARDDGDLSFPNLGVAVQLIFMSLNSPVYWYKERPGQTEEEIKKLAHEVVVYALTGLGADRGRILQ